MFQNLSFEEMDKAAKEAEQELKAMDEKIIESITNWWFKWYLKAGHRRLGRMLVKIYKEKHKAE